MLVSFQSRVTNVFFSLSPIHTLVSSSLALSHVNVLWAALLGECIFLLLRKIYHLCYLISHISVVYTIFMTFLWPAYVVKPSFCITVDRFFLFLSPCSITMWERVFSMFLSMYWLSIKKKTNNQLFYSTLWLFIFTQNSRPLVN